MESIKVLLLVMAGMSEACCLEVGVPERYLRPRNFNPHPYTDALALTPGALPEEHPYALFQRPSLRGEDSNAPVQFPKVPEAVTTQPPPRLKPADVKHPLRLGGAAPPRVPGPLPFSAAGKNYAFSYAVLDHHSGDDFSHSQAHTGDATKGEYRVKLPDGRTQVVSYTADSRGYRADVRYDNEITDYRAAYKPSNYKQASSYKNIFKGPNPPYKALYKPQGVPPPPPPPPQQLYYPPQQQLDYGDYQEDYTEKQYTPIHEDYPDTSPPPPPPAPRYYSAQPQQYEYVVTTPAPHQGNVYILPSHIKPYH